MAKIINLLYNQINHEYSISDGPIKYGKNKKNLGLFDIENELGLDSLIKSIIFYLPSDKKIILRIDKILPNQIRDRLVKILNSPPYKKEKLITEDFERD